eukprot:scpid80824/ scgid22911/ Diamine acetyltransferase 2; Polyamine N-acetyltransferase 2; Spermidine/spermine N(1)-acetyltransferase 2
MSVKDLKETMAEPVRLREATAEDMPAVSGLLKAFLPFVEEPGLHEMVTTEDLIRDGFGDRRYFTILLLELVKDGEAALAIGYTMYLYKYSYGGRSLYMEAIFILPEHHRKGYGKVIMRHLAKLALENHCRSLTWQGVLDRPSANFYRSLGAKDRSDVSDFQLDVEGMMGLIEGAT